MKFHQIPIGDTFLHQDKRHKKLNNIMALDMQSQKQVFMKRSADVSIDEPSAISCAAERSPYEALLNRALNDFQGACLKQFKSYRDGVSMDMAEAEINKIREEIIQHYKDKF